MEVYGTKPKRFTKEWWEYFWDYYKLHTIATILVLTAVISTLVECAHRKDYDLQLDFISENPITTDAASKLTSLLENNIADVTENGKTEAFVTYIDMGEHSDPQYTQAMYTKFSVEIGYTESFVFLLSKKYADTVSEAGALEEAKNWCSAESYNGYCVSLSGCEYLEDLGIDTTDLYVGVIKMRERDKEADRIKNLPKQENGIRFARFLINEE